MEDLVDTLNKIDKSSFNNDASRQRLIDAAKQFTYRLEKPWERAFDFLLCRESLMESLRTAQFLNLFSHLSSTPKTLKELAADTGCDPALLLRILRVLVVWHYVDEPAVDAYVATDHSIALSDPHGLQACIDLFFSPERNTQMLRLPEYFREHGYKNPQSIQDAPWKWCAGKPDYPGNAWDWYVEIGLGGFNNNFLNGLRMDLPPWTELFDISTFLVGWDPKTVLAVDIGGGKGRDISNLARAVETKHPHAELVLQDRPETIAQAKQEGSLHPKVQAMSHDFFKSNPITGARVYFFHQVLHDWPDKEASQILTPVREAMTPGYSKLLLMELVLPDRVKETSERDAGLDLNMLSVHGAAERQEAVWKSVIEDAGLKYVGYTPIHGRISIIEAVA